MTVQTDRLSSSPTYDGSPIRGSSFEFVIGLGSAVAVGLVTNPTLAAGDVQVSKDGGAYANITTLPTTYPTGGNTIIITLSATEMEAEVVVVRFTDQTSPKEWTDTVITILTENP